MRDGWIGLFKTSKHMTEPLVTSCNIQIDESMDNVGEFRSLTNAQIYITELNIHPDSPRGISTIVVEIAKVESEADYLEQNYRVPREWIIIDSHNLSSELTGSANSLSITVKNIPAHTDGYRHKFRISFLASDGSKAKFHFNQSNDKLVCEVIDRRFIGEEEISGDISGFSIAAYKDDQLISVFPIPVLVQDGATLYVPTDISIKSGYEFGDINKFQTVPDEYFYAFGIDGSGEVFNGIDDFAEIYGCLEAAAEVFYVTNTYQNAQWITDDDQLLITTQDSINIRCKNMFDHPDVSLIKAGTGEAVTLTNQQLKTIDFYSFIMYVSDTQAPTYKYPTMNEPNGVWRVVKEIPAPKVKSELMPYIKATIQNIPEPIYYAFFVGFRTKRSNTPQGIDSFIPFDTPEPLPQPVGGLTAAGSADIVTETT